jgi:hypothetical protein
MSDFWYNIAEDIPWNAIVAITIIGLILMVIVGAFVLGLIAAIHYIYGEDYKFNMTRELQDETNVLPLCYDTGMEIEMIKDFCAERYGGLNTPYGEPIK